MKKEILLIIPKLPTKYAQAFNLNTDPFGGWIDGLLDNYISDDYKLSLAVFTRSKTDSIDHKTLDDTNIYLIKYTSSKNIETFFNKYKFDLFHLIGIEHAYIKDIKDLLDYKKTLVTITGIQFEYANAYLSNYNFYNKNINPLLYLNLKFQGHLIRQRGKVEKEILKRVRYAVGRTAFDKKSILSVNKNIRYFTCNEILRENFYTSKKWDINTKENYSIFVSQGASPIKGCHMVLEIVKLLKQDFKNVKCYIAGEDLSKASSLLTKLKSSYAYLINSLIKKYKLENNIVFTGFLNSKEMEDRLLKSHVFLMPSSIENSVNSLQEAMLLGVPSLTSLVGGVPSLISPTSVLTYPFKDVDRAYLNLKKIFMDDDLSLSLSKNSIDHIEKLASRKTNTQALLDIYKEILG